MSSLVEIMRLEVNRPGEKGPRILDGILFKCVDETLGSMMGLVAKNTIYLRVLTKCLVSRDDLPAHIDDLVMVMQEGFGEKSTAMITKAIGKRLFSELQLNMPSQEDLSLQDYVNEAFTQTVTKPSLTLARSS
jgi:hypothetical protein